MRTLQRALFAMLLGAVAFGAQAALVIDNFTGALNLNLPAGGANPAGVSGGNLPGAANVAGGARNAIMVRTGGSDAARLSIDTDVGGALRFATDSAANILLTWDGDTNNVLNHGLSLDLSDGGLNNVFQAAVRASASVATTLTVYSGAANFSTASFNTPGSGAAVPFTTLDLPFASFVAGGGTGADFGAVTAITLGLAAESKSFDVQFDFLRVDAAPNPVPEPSSAALLLAGFALAGGLMRRKKRGATGGSADVRPE